MDLDVQTPLIRQAADVIDEASSAFGGAAGGALRCPLTDQSLGRSAVAREVAAAASRRVLQAVDAARLLSEFATDTADRLRTVASAFEKAEFSAVDAPR